MMEFISIPLVVGIITLGIYGLFELFVRRKERIVIIEKLGSNFDVSTLLNTFSLPRINLQGGFGTLKIACLLLGVGLGLLVGLFLSINVLDGMTVSDHYRYETSGIIYGASVMVFGGLGLLTAFIVERKYAREGKK